MARKQSRRSFDLDRPAIAVLVPAHNEETVIQSTLETLLPQLSETDRLVVIADNCSDRTAEIAQAMGATVIERNDLEHRGKGFALDFGVQHIASQPPDVVVLVDADCMVAPGSIGKIAQVAYSKQRPVQATYLFLKPQRPTPKEAVSLLALTMKNLVRPLGLRQLGMPCLLTGTGMAFPWLVLKQAPLASDNLVEDMNLGLDLAIAGYPPIFCPDAQVTSVLPQKEQAAKSQRTRWEHGHLQTLQTKVPQLLRTALTKQRLDLLVLALDLLIPPLSLLVMLWTLVMGVALSAYLMGFSALPATILGVGGGLIVLSVLSAWAKFCRSDLPITMLLAIPLYVLWKIPLYFSFLLKPQKMWVRTERDSIS